jgi:hypothetical protein
MDDEAAAAPDTAGSGGPEVPGAPATAPTPVWDRVTTVLVRLAALAAALVVVSGVPLVVLYRPNSVGWLRTLHGTSSTLLLGAAAGVVVAMVASTVSRHPAWAGWAAAVLGFVAAAGGAFSGAPLGWDRLAVTVGTGDVPGGVIGPLSGGVRRVLVGDVELTQGTYLAWTLVHLVAVPLVAAAAGWLLWRRWPRGDGGNQTGTA